MLIDQNGRLTQGGSPSPLATGPWNLGGNTNVNAGGTNGTLGTTDNEDLVIVAGGGGTGTGTERMRISNVDGATTITSSNGGNNSSANSPFKIIGTQNFGGDLRLFEVKYDGSVFSREFFVQQTAFPFPDYVFNKDYKLLSFAELESYLMKNKHLPNVPSAKEIEEKGAPLGELQRVGLEKTEELYLYVIELNKKVEKLEEQNKKLTAEVADLKKK